LKITSRRVIPTQTRRWNIRASEPKRSGTPEITCAALGVGVITVGVLVSGVLRWVLIATGLQFFAPILGRHFKDKNK
jgi:hypothetical protein